MTRSARSDDRDVAADAYRLLLPVSYREQHPLGESARRRPPGNFQHSRPGESPKIERGGRSVADDAKGFQLVIRFSTRENAEQAADQIEYAMRQAGLEPFAVEIEEGRSE